MPGLYFFKIAYKVGKYVSTHALVEEEDSLVINSSRGKV